MRLVENYLRSAGNWSQIRSFDRSPGHPFADPLYSVIAHSAGPVTE